MKHDQLMRMTLDYILDDRTVAVGAYNGATFYAPGGVLAFPTLAHVFNPNKLTSGLDISKLLPGGGIDSADLVTLHEGSDMRKVEGGSIVSLTVGGRHVKWADRKFLAYWPYKHYFWLSLDDGTSPILMVSRANHILRGALMPVRL